MYGFDVRSTSKDSMQHDIFLDYCIHFVKHLPSLQGKRKDAVILLLNGHKSRWTLNALQYLTENNVWSFFLPSHTSIVTQPNDNMVNKCLHTCILDVTNEMSSILSKCNATSLKITFYQVWERFVENEHRSLQLGIENSVQIACRKCGYAPFDRKCDHWKCELDHVHEFNEYMKQINVSNNTPENVSVEDMHEIVPVRLERTEWSDIFSSISDESSFLNEYNQFRDCKGCYEK